MHKPLPCSPLSMFDSHQFCRYTIVRNGERKLYIPNASFLTREFMVVDDPETQSRQRRLRASSLEDDTGNGSHGISSHQGMTRAYVLGPDGHPRWMNAVPHDGYFMDRYLVPCTGMNRAYLCSLLPNFNRMAYHVGVSQISIFSMPASTFCCLANRSPVRSFQCMIHV